MCFLVFASVGHFALDQTTPQNTPKAGTAMIVFACLFIAAFARQVQRFLQMRFLANLRM